MMQAAIGKRTEVIIPVGLEKRIFGNITQAASKVNDPRTDGMRMLPLTGTIITDLKQLKY
jgi:hypothetical protein